jgi:L,D-peptidoglycan transpeptidase YkuD (ErfK/YbiS/YcfS/YnhG family)
MMSRRPLMALAVLMFAPYAYAGGCPDPIGRASHLVLVTTSTMNVAVAKMQLFTRAAAGEPWTRSTAAEPAVVGQAGLGWGYTFLRFKRDEEPEKVEGDKRTPAGFFSIGSSFGFSDSNLPGYLLIKAGETVCVEDPSSPLYNRIGKRAEIGANVKADDMRRTPLYRRGLFVEYPSDRASRRGSCIFIHIWSAPNKGTAGCIALPEARVEALQDFSQAGAVLAILPEAALDRFPDCLPPMRPAR